MSEHDQGAGQAAGQAAADPLAVVASSRVLVVDDQASNVALLERIIRSAGIADVHGLTDPRLAVSRCLELGADLLLLDLQMPGMDGFAVMSALRNAQATDTFLPVLVLTADTTTAARDRALAAGATDFVTKPFDVTEVVLRVRNLLRTRALYVATRRHTTALQAELDKRAQEERRIAAEQHRRRERIDAVVAGHGLTMVFQPIADLDTGDVVGLEALARFTHQPKRPPNEWFNEAAEVGRGVQLELAAVHAALNHLDRLPPEAFLSLNLSPGTALRPELASTLERVPADRIMIELTEHAPVTVYEPLLAALAPLRARGVRIAVDDAGAGYSDLQHILHLRPDVIKLDIALTRAIDTDPARRALATALISFGHEIDATILAEGVETHAELRTLRTLDIPWGQGYHLARPGPVPLANHRLATLTHGQ